MPWRSRTMKRSAGAGFEVDIAVKHLSQIASALLRGRDLHVRTAAQPQAELELMIGRVDMHVANRAAAAAVERVGDAEDGDEPAHDLLLRRRELREVVVRGVGRRLAVI